MQGCGTSYPDSRAIRFVYILNQNMGVKLWGAQLNEGS